MGTEPVFSGWKMWGHPPDNLQCTDIGARRYANEFAPAQAIHSAGSNSFDHKVIA